MTLVLILTLDFRRRQVLQVGRRLWWAWLLTVVTWYCIEMRLAKGSINLKWMTCHLHLGHSHISPTPRPEPDPDLNLDLDSRPQSWDGQIARSGSPDRRQSPHATGLNSYHSPIPSMGSLSPYANTPPPPLDIADSVMR